MSRTPATPSCGQPGGEGQRAPRSAPSSIVVPNSTSSAAVAERRPRAAPGLSRHAAGPACCRAVTSRRWMSSKPPFDMMTTRSPALALARRSSGRCRRRCPRGARDRRRRAGRRRAPRPTAAPAPGASTGTRARGRSRRRPPNARAKSCWKMRRHDDADRGSKMAQMRRPGMRRRAPPRAFRRPRSDGARSRRRRSTPLTPCRRSRAVASRP